MKRIAAYTLGTIAYLTLVLTLSLFALVSLSLAASGLVVMFVDARDFYGGDLLVRGQRPRAIPAGDGHYLYAMWLEGESGVEVSCMKDGAALGDVEGYLGSGLGELAVVEISGCRIESYYSNDFIAAAAYPFARIRVSIFR